MIDFLNNLPTESGVYLMQDKTGKIIYVGKAKNLKNRLKSYFNKTNDIKTACLVKEINKIDITITKNEIEALLLENKLINKLKPKYNVIFKDDKSYPYILLTNDKYPGLYYFRSKHDKKVNGKLYGPYPSATILKDSLDLLAKIFNLRTCSLSVFNNRTRPCLEYQLKRCSAPCVNYISEEEYNKDVTNSKMFLENKSNDLIKILTNKMQQASLTTNYELAAKLRDQINTLKALQQKQSIINKGKADVDVIGAAMSESVVCIHLLRVRQGDVLYSKQFFSKKNITESINYFVEKFIVQNYSEKKEIKKILTAVKVDKKIEQAINIKIVSSFKGVFLNWQLIAQKSAEEALASKDKESRFFNNAFVEFSKIININVKKIVCFDVSHTGGKETIATAVVFNNLGKETDSYRLFNIKNPKECDDYYSLEQALLRYINHLLAKNLELPDVMIVDGGKGQLNILKKVITTIKLSKKLFLMSIAKGFKRKVGLETVYVLNGKLNLQSNNTIFKLLLKIRDEAHRFAIKSHRKKRDRL